MFEVQLTVLDWDKLSSNNHVGDASWRVEGAPRRDERTGLYEGGVGVVGEGMREFKLPLPPAEGVPWEAKHNHVITFRCVLFYSFIHYLFRPLTHNPQSEIPTLRCLPPTILVTIPQTI